MLGRALSRHSEFRLVGYATTSPDLLKIAADHHAQVAIVRENLNDSPRSGLAAIQQLARFHPETRSLLLADRLEREDVVSAFQSGARGIMAYPEADFEMLAKAVRQIDNGQIWANSLQLQYLVETLSQIKRAPVVTAEAEARLSKREQEVLMLLAEGYSNKEIAASLRVSEHTVKNHLFQDVREAGRIQPDGSSPGGVRISLFPAARHHSIIQQKFPKSARSPHFVHAAILF